MIAAEVGTFEWDVAADRLFGDENFERLFGVNIGPEGSAPIAAFIEAIHPDDRKATLALVQSTLETGVPYETEYRIVAQGRTRWVHVRGNVERDGTGRPLRFAGVLIDISTHKQTELERNAVSAELRRLSNVHETILSNTDDFAYIFDRQGRFLYANRRLLTVWAKTLEQIVGKTCLELGYPDWHAAMHMREIEQVIATKQPIRGEVPFTGASGISGVYDYIFKPVLGANGEVEVIAGTTRDVSDRKRAEQELQRARDAALAASRAKDDFLAALSHELRTPLNPVLLLASDAASNPAVPAELRATFETIRKNTEIEARLIDDLLDLTGITRGKLKMNKSRTDVHAVLRDTLANLAPEFREKRLELTVELAAVRTAVEADPVRLSQVFANLLKNAIKFTPEGGAVTVASRTDAGRIEIRIADTGLGLTAGELERVFDPFTQGEHATDPEARRYGGLGIGLAIARSVVEAHGGELEAASAGRNRGSAFSVRLPWSAVPAELSGTAEVFESSVEPAAANQPGPRRVLVVEDHEPTRVALARLLRRRGYNVTVADTLATARAVLERQSIDLLVSDIGLPDGSGMTLMAEVRERHGVPGIALTGYGMADDVERSRSAGFTRHLTKPIRVESLEAALAAVFAAAVCDAEDRPPVRAC